MISELGFSYLIIQNVVAQGYNFKMTQRKQANKKY